MGCVNKISDNTFPKQGDYLGKRCRVIFHYGHHGPVEHMGTIIRDDMERPHPDKEPLTIIQLDDGRVVMSTECQYAPYL